MTNGNYKIIYFDCRALAEPARMMFHYKGVPFEDFRLPHFFKGGDPKVWEELKPKMPYGQTPVLEFDGCDGMRHQVAQSQTIYRFLGKKFGLAGLNDWDQIRVDELAEWLKDIWRDFVPYLVTAYGPNPADFFDRMGYKHTSEERMLEEKIRPMITERFVPIIEQKLKNAGFLMPFGLSWVDFVVAEYCTTFNNIKKLDFFGKYPTMAKYTQRVYSANGALKKYVQERPAGLW